MWRRLGPYLVTDMEMSASIRREEIIDAIERFARVLAHNLEEMDKDQPTNRHSFALLTNISNQLQEDKKDGLFASGSSATLAQSIYQHVWDRRFPS